MNCKDVEKLLPLHVGGDLVTKKTHLLTAHLMNCASCAASAMEYRESVRLTQDFEPPAFSPETYDEIRQSVLREISSGSAKSARRFPGNAVTGLFSRPEWAFAALSLVAISLLAFYFIASRTNRREETVNVPVTYPEQLPPFKPSKPSGPYTTPDPVRQNTNPAGNVMTARKPRPFRRNKSINHSTISPQQIIGPTETVAASAEPPDSPAKPLRMEMQTSDSNIRIIWFSNSDAKQDIPGKTSKGI
jgi:hypothetical protein